MEVGPAGVQPACCQQHQCCTAAEPEAPHQEDALGIIHPPFKGADTYNYAGCVTPVMSLAISWTDSCLILSCNILQSLVVRIHLCIGHEALSQWSYEQV